MSADEKNEPQSGSGIDRRKFLAALVGAATAAGIIETTGGR